VIKKECCEVLIWSGGDEGRLWEWRPGTQWRVFEHYNYRHTFKESEVSQGDVAALRRHFDVADDIPIAKLLQLSPDELTRLSRRVGVE